MPKRKQTLSPAEWNVMQIVWRLSSGAARDIYQAAGDEHGMAASNVKTVLRRLVEKGHLETTTVGNCYVYSPTRSRLSTLCSDADRLLEHSRAEGAGRVLAKDLVRTRQHISKFHMMRSNLQSLALKMQTMPSRFLNLATFTATCSSLRMD